MKKIYYSVILSLAFSLFSCSDFLDRESLSELSNGNFWNTEADATKALVGCYDALQSEGSLGFCWPGGNTCSLRELQLFFTAYLSGCNSQIVKETPSFIGSV